MNPVARVRRIPVWSWVWLIIGILYLVLPLYGLFDFSLRMQRDVIGFKAYQSAFADIGFWRSFGYSMLLAVLTIAASIILVVPTAYWIRLRLPEARRIVEFITLLPFVIPVIVLVFGMIRLYSTPMHLPFTEIDIMPPLTNSVLGTNILMIAGYMVLGLPYMYRSIDTGLRSVDIRTLTEAAQSLGASWYPIIAHVILPNIRSALLSGAMLIFAIVLGELVLATYFGVPAFGPYLLLLGHHRSYEPAALAFATFLLTWAAMGIIQLVTGGRNQGFTGGR
jgi:putative spermidine/putrescine transport system permease protein